MWRNAGSCVRVLGRVLFLGVFVFSFLVLFQSRHASFFPCGDRASALHVLLQSRHTSCFSWEHATALRQPCKCTWVHILFAPECAPISSHAPVRCGQVARPALALAAKCFRLPLWTIDEGSRSWRMCLGCGQKTA
eukprot:1157629-Pelagomonas_calceolata.AAC.3